MANRLFEQVLYSLTKRLTVLQGKLNLVQAVKATLTAQGITYTAVAFGASGNAITVTVVGGGTAGSEVVTVDGNAITVQVEAGVSTVTQVRTAINGSTPAAALVAATGTSSSTVSAASAASLTGGVNGVASCTIKGASAERTGVGEYTITLDDAYAALVCANANLMASTAVDLVPQFKSEDVASGKTVVVRTLAGATATEVAAACSLHVSLFLRNSSIA